MTENKIVVEQLDHVLVATISNPPHQLMDPQIMGELAQLAQRADTDPTVTGVVVTGGHPDRFIAHFDVSLILANSENGASLPPKTLRRAFGAVAAVRQLPGGEGLLERSPLSGLLRMSRMHGVFRAIERSNAVWVAALNGMVGGGGLELALACDVRYQRRDNALMAQSEIFLGFTPGSGGTQRLTRILGTSRALAVCLDGGPLTPDEAKELGIVDGVFDGDELLDAAIAEATRLGQRPKHAIGAIKRAIYEGGSMDLTNGLRYEASEFLSAATTPESIEAQRAYVRRTEELGDLPVAVDDEIERVLAQGRFS
jgi:enoyl-CoA hydratase/carnithine racemase